uniref:Uncharacterized protein n=1 Tax=Arundo donax TaxID=35708 RepID=A0A0A8ZEC9_ARUDO
MYSMVAIGCWYVQIAAPARWGLPSTALVDGPGSHALLSRWCRRLELAICRAHRW